MLCCAVAAYFIFRYVIRWREASKYLGFDSGQDEEYPWTECGELEQFKN